MKRIAAEGRLGKSIYIDRDGYVFRQDRLLGKPVRLHRYFWELYNGPIPEGYVVHHKNENKKCNCIANLELCTIEEHNKILHDRSESSIRVWASRSHEEKLRITTPGRQSQLQDIESMRAKAAHMRTFHHKKETL